MKHVPVLLKEILDFLPKIEHGCVVDVTAGGGGHFFEMLRARPQWRGICLDQDLLAAERIARKANEEVMQDRVSFYSQNFEHPPADLKMNSANFILADLGVSSFQLDDRQRGMSLHSDSKPDFRMRLEGVFDFQRWIAEQSEARLTQILEDLGEEPKAKMLARAMKSWDASAYQSAKILADKIAQALKYPSPSKRHPATRSFQAFRMAVNNELGVLDAFLKWAPQHLAPGGRLAVITFHSLEDRIVKNRFKDLESEGGFVILTKKALVPGDHEVDENTRARSSKLRVLEKT